MAPVEDRIEEEEDEDLVNNFILFDVFLHFPFI